MSHRRVAAVCVAIVALLAVSTAPQAWALPVSPGELAGMELLYAVNNGQFDFNDAYTTDNSGSIAPGSFDRVGYYVELGNNWVWVSMDTFNADPTKLGVPKAGTKIVENGTLVHNLYVETNHPNVTPGDHDNGIIEFWASNYGASGGGLYGSNDSRFDWKDSGGSTSGGHGSFQVFTLNDTLTSGKTVFGITANGGSGIGDQATSEPDWTFGPGTSSYAVRNLEIWVGNANQPPTLSNLDGDSFAYMPGVDGVHILDQGTPATADDPPPIGPNVWNGGDLTISIPAGGVPADDVLWVLNEGGSSGQIGLSGLDISYEGVTIGTAAGGSGASDLVVTFNSNAGTAAISALLDNITYANGNPLTLPTTRLVDFMLTDGDGAASLPSRVQIAMNVGGTIDSYVWDGTGDGMGFGVAANWEGDAGVPDSNDNAIFRTADPGSVDIGGSRFVGTLRFDGAGSYTLGNGTLGVQAIDQQATAGGYNTIMAQINGIGMSGTVSAGTLAVLNVDNAIGAGSTFTIENAGSELVAKLGESSFSLDEADIALRDGGALTLTGTQGIVDGLRASIFRGNFSSDVDVTPLNLGGRNYEVSGSRVFTSPDTGTPYQCLLQMTEDPGYNVVAEGEIRGWYMFGHNGDNYFADNFASAFSGMFIPTVSGNHTFRWSNDDRGWMFMDLDGNGTFEPSEAIGSYAWNSNGTVNLTAEQQYNFMYMTQEWGGGDTNNFWFTPPGGSEVRVNTITQAGMWRHVGAGQGSAPGDVSVTGAGTVNLGADLGKMAFGSLTMGPSAQLTVNSLLGGQDLEFAAVSLSGAAAIDLATGSPELTLRNIGETAPSSIAYTGSGTVYLPTANTYTGLTSIGSGVTASVTANGALGTTDAGTVVADGGSLKLSGGVAYGMAEALTIRGSGNAASDGALHNAASDNSFSGPITLADNAVIRSSANTLRLYGGIETAGRQLTFHTAGNIEVHSQPITGSGGVRKEGNGWLYMMNGINSTYTGVTTITDGVLDARGNGALGTADGGTVVQNQATLLIRDGRTLADDVSITGLGHDNWYGAIRSENNANTMTGAITVNGTSRIYVNETSLTLTGQVTGGSIDKQGAGTLILTNPANDYASIALNDGELRIANTGALGGTTSLSVDGGQALEFDGSMTVDNSVLTSLGVSNGALRSISGTTTVDVPIDVGVLSDITFGGDGALVVTQAFGNGGTPVVTNALEHYGFHASSDANHNLNGNGGLMSGGDPSTHPDFYGLSVLIDGPGGRGLDFANDQDFIDTGAVGRNDYYQNLWLGTLHVDAAHAGSWQFCNGGDDDRGAIWIDLDQDGVFQAPSGMRSGENISWEDGGTKTYTLTEGDYMIAFGHTEFTSGSRARFRLRAPGMSGQVIVKPADPSQAGFFPYTLTPSNSVAKDGDGVVTLSGDNTFNGPVTVKGGMIVAAHDNAFGLPGGDIALSANASVGFAGGVSVAGENITGADGKGAGQLGTLVNVGGTNAFLGNVTASPTPSVQEVSLASEAGTLAVGAPGGGNILDLQFSKLTLDGPGEVVVYSDIQAKSSPEFIAAFNAYLFNGNDTDLPGDSSQLTSKMGSGQVWFANEVNFINFWGDEIIGLNNSNPNDPNNYANTFIGMLTLDGTGTANVKFRHTSADDANRIRIDLNGNGSFEGGSEDPYGGDRGGNYTTGTVTVPRGTPLAVALQHREGGGGSRLQPEISLDNGSTWQRFTPGGMAGATFGMILVPTPEVVKVGSGTAILAGTNTYSGPTTVLEGTLVAASDAALGSTAAGTVVESGGTLGLQGGVTISGEAITLDGSGAPGLPGALANISGSNLVAASSTIAAKEVSLGEFGIGSAAGTLTVDADVDLQYSKLTVGGAGDTVITGVIAGYGADFSQFTPGGLNGFYYDLNNSPNNRNAGEDLLDPISTLEALTPRATALTPRVDFGAGTTTTQGDGSVLDRGGYDSGSVPPWQGLFNDLGITTDMDGDQIAGLWTGYINVPEAATYRFTTRSDDGSVLFIDGTRIVNNNYFQGMTNRNGSIALTAGLHTIKVGFYEGGGGAGVQASWEQIDGASPFSRRIIEPSVLGDYVLLEADNSLVKTGTGTVTLAGDNTYNGTTTIAQGTLLVNGHTSGQGDYLVQSGGILGGTGTIGLAPGASVIVEAGGLLSPGTSSGTLTVERDLLLDSGSAYVWELAAGRYDTVHVTGTLTLEDWTLRVVDAGGSAHPEDKFYLFTGPFILGGSNHWEIDWSQALVWGDNSHYLGDPTIGIDGGGVYVTGIETVPEPATISLLGLGGLWLVRRRRKQR